MIDEGGKVGGNKCISGMAYWGYMMHVGQKRFGLYDTCAYEKTPFRVLLSKRLVIKASKSLY